MSTHRAREAVKAAVRRNTTAYELVRRRRAKRQEQAYVLRRDGYARSAGPVFSDRGYLFRSREILAASWRGPRRRKNAANEVRLFGVVADDPGGPQLARPLVAQFDTVLFDLAEYRSLEAVWQSGDLAWRPPLQRELVEAFESAHAESPIDLVFAYASHLELEPTTLHRIRRSGVPIAVLCLDDKHAFAQQPGLGYPNGQQPLVGAVDVHLTNSRECVRWYLGENAAVFYMPQGIDPDLYVPAEGSPNIDVSFMGHRYGYRGRFIAALEASGIQVSCFGPGWDRIVSHEEKVQIYSKSRINLGVGGVAFSDRMTCVKGRDFEVPAAGGLYLTTYDPELPDLFHIGREILCYRNEIDCVEQIRYYLENNEVARAIARAGRERCLRSHTWGARISELLRWMGILAPIEADTME